MKITVNTDQLKAAISTVIPALAIKSDSVYTRAYEFIHINVTDNLMTLKCCNLSIQIETSISVSSEGDDTLLVPGKLFAEVVRTLPDEETQLERSGETVCIVSGAMNMDLSTLRPDEFAGMSLGEPEACVRLPQQTLKRMILQTAPFAMLDDSKPILKGVNIEFDTDTLEMVALDNLKLAKRTETVQSFGEASVCDIIIHSKLLESAARVLEDNTQLVQVFFSKRNLIIKTDIITIVIARMEGQYVNYKNILPSHRDSRIRLNRKNLCSLIERAYLVARDDKRNIVKLNFEGEVLMISVSNEIGRMTDEMSIFMSGDPIKISFNAKYLLDVIKGIEDEEIIIDLTIKRGPCVVRPVEKENYYYLLVPVSEV